MAFENLIIFGSVFGFLLILLKWLLKRAKRLSLQEVIRFNPDQFLHDNKYTWDYVFVFKVFGEDEKLTAVQRDYTLKKTIRKLNRGGLSTKMFYSVQKDEVYVKVRASLERLKVEAARISYKMLLDEQVADKRARRGYVDENRRLVWAPLEISSSKRFSNITAFKFIYGKFVNEERMDELYKRHTTTGSYFRSIDRIKLLQGIMEAEPYEGGCGLNINTMVKKNAVLAAFPLHTWPEKTSLQNSTLNLFMLPWKTPMHLIKDYFGEKVGIYFLFLTHYTTWLISAGVVGALIYVHVGMYENPNVPSVPAFCAFMALWTTFFLEFWKRKEITHSMYWGTQGYESVEQDRPEFEGALVTSPIDGTKVKWADSNKLFKAQLCSQATISTSLVAVVGAVASIFVFKIYSQRAPLDRSLTIGKVNIAGVLVSLANAIQIQVMSAVYSRIATWLNDAENHRTDTAYEDSLIAKTFIFQFVNSFASLFYIGFIKAHVEPEGCIGSCLSELSTALSTIFLTRLVTGNISSIILAWFKNEKKKKEESEGVEPGCVMTPAEQEYALEPYDVIMSTFVNYAELAVQYGYATLFAAAFPLAPIMACLNSYIKIRVDVWRMTQIMRRPEPRTAEDIGTWFGIFELMSTACVVTNCGLVFFTGEFFQELSMFQRMACFVAFEHLLICVKYVFGLMVPDVPDEVDIQLKRSEFITSKLIDNTPDEREDGEASKEEFDFVINPTDNDYWYEDETAVAKGDEWHELAAAAV